MDWVQIISNIGFPIACVIGLAWFYVKDKDKTNAIIEKNTEAINTLVNCFSGFTVRLEEVEKKVEDIDAKIDNMK